MAVNRAEDGGHNDRAPLISRKLGPYRFPDDFVDIGKRFHWAKAGLATAHYSLRKSDLAAAAGLRLGFTYGPPSVGASTRAPIRS
jgi:hypothetical protein